MAAQNLAARLFLLTQNPQIVFGVLIEVFGLNGVAARRCIARHGDIALIPAARIALPGTTLSWSRWARGILRTFRPEWPTARTLVQDILRCCWGWPNLGSRSLSDQHAAANTIVIVLRYKNLRAFPQLPSWWSRTLEWSLCFIDSNRVRECSPFRPGPWEQALRKRALVLRLYAQWRACSSRASR
jgi:hypothetical protein